MAPAEQGRFSQDLTCPLSIISEQLTLPKALELCLVCYMRRNNTVILVYLLWGLHVLRTIGLHEDASAGPKYTKTEYRWLMHFNKNHNLVLISLMVSQTHQLCSVLSPSSDWTWELEEAAGFITQVIGRKVPVTVGLIWNKMHHYHCCAKK